MALIKGKQIQDTSVSLGKLSGAGTVTVSGTITAPAASLIISTAPVAPTQAANKEYVDSVATGLDIKQSVTAIYRESTPAAGGTPEITVQNQVNGLDIDDQDMYTIITNGSPINQLVLDNALVNPGDRVLIAIKRLGRQKVNGIYVFDGNNLSRAEDADNVTPNVGEVSGGLFTFVEQGDVYSDTGWVLSSPNGAIANSGPSGLWDFTNNDSGNAQLEFTQFSAAGVAEAGVGLTRTGTKFNVNYDNSSIGINGDDELYIMDNGVTNAMLVNDFTTFTGNSGTGNVVLGGTLNIHGGANGIDTAMSGSTLTINLDLTELTTVQAIDDEDFIAISQRTNTGGTGENQKITFADLKTQIGAASELQIGVESETPITFDLDIDNLDFSSGPGLTFTRNIDSSGTLNVAETLTITLTNNNLNVQQSTNLTVAALGNTDITIPSAAEVFSVTINGVALKKTTNWVWPYNTQSTVVRITALPYAIETSDEIEITYRVY